MVSTRMTLVSGPIARLHRARVARVDEAGVDTVPRSQARQQLDRPAVQRIRRQHLAAGRQREGGRRHRGHARREHQAALGALEVGQRRRQRTRGWVSVACVQERLTRRRAFGRGGVAIDVVRGLEDGRRVRRLAHRSQPLRRPPRVNHAGSDPAARALPRWPGHGGYRTTRRFCSRRRRLRASRILRLRFTEGFS